MIEVPKTAIDLAKRFEGFERTVKRGVEITAVPYICPAGFWTIGYGHLCDPKHPPITSWCRTSIAPGTTTIGH